VTILGITMGVVQGLMFIGLGAILVIASLVGGVLLLAKAIYSANEHDQSKCECVECQRRRWTAAEKRQQKRVEDRKHNQQLPLISPANRKTDLVSTVELAVNDVVWLRSGQWRVTEKMVTMLGIFVRLENIADPRQKSRIRIRNEEIEQKVWALRPKDWTR
jgi:hypothetical protein